MSDVPPEVERALAKMDPGAWDAFVARVRAPDTAEQFRSIAAKSVKGDRLESLCRVANVSAFVGDEGQIDEAKVQSHLSALFGQPQQPQDSGPYRAGTAVIPGAAGAAEARRRFEGTTGYVAGGREVIPGAPGAAGSVEAKRRFGKKEQ
ncbi:MAG: hypothetical protein JWR32_3655 [Mycobacterium sp.]|jgi:hypothetical protein|nr:hypothetical protein [Mycobacterium sp.]